MIPKYPLSMVTRKVAGQARPASKSFETLDAAHSFAGTILRASNVTRVVITCILDDTRGNDSGDVLGFDHKVPA